MENSIAMIEKRIKTVADVMITRMEKDGAWVFFFGNGGSASDSCHLAAELINSYKTPLAAVALSVDVSAITSIANDRGFEHVFSRQLEAVGSDSDIAIGISTSGKSENVIRGIEVANKMGMLTIGMTGILGEKLIDLVDHVFIVDSDKPAQIQEGYMKIGHELCDKIGAYFDNRRD